MNNNQFLDHFYDYLNTPSTRAARLVLVEKIGVNEAARREGSDKGAVSRAVKSIRGE